MQTTFTKDPEAVLDYAVDWSSWLQAGETISSYTVTVPTGITLDSDHESAGIVTAWLSGGTAGATYAIEVKITTSLGRTDERTFRIQVAER
jgi:hypothetical protein